jgi:hypothetical protein
MLMNINKMLGTFQNNPVKRVLEQNSPAKLDFLAKKL